MGREIGQKGRGNRLSRGLETGTPGMCWNLQVLSEVGASGREAAGPQGRAEVLRLCPEGGE